MILSVSLPLVQYIEGGTSLSKIDRRQLLAILHHRHIKKCIPVFRSSTMTPSIRRLITELTSKLPSVSLTSVMVHDAIQCRTTQMVRNSGFVLNSSVVCASFGTR
jgi:5-methylcytosine-specific restriction endonuclease McrBC regulatory subunit McrC